jgi:hypothetical protein
LLIESECDEEQLSAHNSEAEAESNASSNRGSNLSVQSVSSSDEEAKDILEHSYDQIVNIIDILFDITILIRETSQKFRISRAATHIERDEEGNDVLSEFKNIVYFKVKGLCSQETPEWLIKRLVEAIAMRRQQFYYQRAHKRRLAKIPTIFPEETHMAWTLTSTSRTIVMPDSITKGKSQVVMPQPSLAPRTTRNRSTAKTYDTIATEIKPEEKQSKSYTTPNYAPSEKRLNENIFPRVPLEPKGKAFECPQCFHVLSNKMREPALWRLVIHFVLYVVINSETREHLLSDLRPYSCISELCDNYDELFETREKWVEHELQFHHDEWWCDTRHITGSSVQVFTSEKEFSDHMLKDHSHSFSPAQFDFLINRGKRSSPFPFKKCPFCQIKIRDIENKLRQEESNFDPLRASVALLTHIGVHIQNFSLLSFLECDENSESQTYNALDRQSDVSEWSSISLEFRDNNVSAAESIKLQTLEWGHQASVLDDVPELDYDARWDSMHISASNVAQEDDPNLVGFVERFRCNPNCMRDFSYFIDNRSLNKCLNSSMITRWRH